MHFFGNRYIWVWSTHLGKTRALFQVELLVLVDLQASFIIRFLVDSNSNFDCNTQSIQYLFDQLINSSAIFIGFWLDPFDHIWQSLALSFWIGLDSAPKFKFKTKNL